MVTRRNDVNRALNIPARALQEVAPTIVFMIATVRRRLHARGSNIVDRIPLLFFKRRRAGIARVMPMSWREQAAGDGVDEEAPSEQCRE